MKRCILKTVILFGAVLVAPSMASCADSEREATSEGEDASTLPPGADGSGDAGDGGDASRGCESGDPACVTEQLSCEQADFCSVPSGADPQFVLTAIWGASANDVWAVGSGGMIVHYDGTAWTRAEAGRPSADTYHAIWGTGPNDVWVVGSVTAILHGPSPWTPMPALTDGVFAGRMQAVWGASSSDVHIGGQPFLQLEGDYASGNHFHYSGGEGGAPFEILAGHEGLYDQATIHAIWGTSADDFWISFDDSGMRPWAAGSLVHVVASGGAPATWTSIDSQSTGVLEGIWGSAAGDVWAVGNTGTLRHFKTGAKSWDIVASPTSAPLHAIWGSGPSDIWAVGDGGTVIHFDGTSWSQALVALPLGRKPNFTGVWGSGPNDVWIVGSGPTFHFTGKKGNP